MRAHHESHDEDEDHAPPTVFDHPGVLASEPEFIEDQAALDDLLAHARDEGVLAYDTEFIGERTYYSKTCLVQIATASRLALVDPLAGVDLAPLWSLVRDGSVRKLVHAGVPDLEPVVRHGMPPPQNVFDTQIAAAFCGFGHAVSLRVLITDLVGALLGPAMKFSQWDHRPLTTRQRRYAADDVRYLLLVRDRLVERLSRGGTLNAAHEECASLEDPATYEPNPHGRRMRGGGSGQLTPRQRHVLHRLIAWRESIARERDLSPRGLIGDDGLINLARLRLRGVEDVHNTPAVPRKIKQELGEGIAGVIAAAATEPLPEPTRRESLTAAQRRFVDRATAVFESLCNERAIAQPMVATRREVKRLALALMAGEPVEAEPEFAGWRGPVLRDLVARLRADGEA